MLKNVVDKLYLQLMFICEELLIGEHILQKPQYVKLEMFSYMSICCTKIAFKV